MNEQDKLAYKTYAQRQFDLGHPRLVPGDVWQAALEYARGKQEPVGEVIDRERACLFEKQELAYGTLLYTAPPAQPSQPAGAEDLAVYKKIADNYNHTPPAAAINEQLLEALKAAVACGMVPSMSARSGGACAHVEQLKVADQIRDAIRAAEAAKGV